MIGGGTTAGLVNLRLTGVDQGQEPRIVGVGSVIDHGIKQVGGDDRCAIGKSTGITQVECHRIRTLLQGISREGGGRQVDPRIADNKVTIGIRPIAIQIKGIVGLVVAAVVQDERQPVKRGVAGPVIVEFDKFCGVRAGCIGINLIDDNVRCLPV